jgi:hypothetical protein
MARSIKKGPYVAFKLLKKLDKMNSGGKKAVIKTWSRASLIFLKWLVTHLQCITEINSFRFMLPKIWLVTVWVSFLQPASSKDIHLKKLNKQSDKSGF